MSRRSSRNIGKCSSSPDSAQFDSEGNDGPPNLTSGSKKGAKRKQGDGEKHPGGKSLSPGEIRKRKKKQAIPKKIPQTSTPENIEMTPIKKQLMKSGVRVAIL